MLLAYTMMNILHGASWGLQGVFMQCFLDTTQELYKSQAGTRETLSALVLRGAVYMLSQVMNGVVNCCCSIYNRPVTKLANKAVFEKLKRLSLEELEDKIDKAVNGAKGVLTLE